MNRDPLARAILAACIVSALLAPGFLLSRGAHSAPVSPSQHSDTYLPLVFGADLLPEDLTATAAAATRTATTTATATTTTTATGSATATGTATTTPTGSATATPTGSATATATATTTATATPSPTIDPLTAQLTIVNKTGFVLAFTLEGPTNADETLAAEQARVIPVRPGSYKITVTTQCGSSEEKDIIFETGFSYTRTYNCP
jgi:hypothetical protein